MKFKLDENFGTRTQAVFEQAGYDVQTVRQEDLQGTSDHHLYEVCRTEGRCLITSQGSANRWVAKIHLNYELVLDTFIQEIKLETRRWTTKILMYYCKINL